MTSKPCLHCGERVANRPRQLCSVCYYCLEIREQYPTLPKEDVKGVFECQSSWCGKCPKCRREAIGNGVTSLVRHGDWAIQRLCRMLHPEIVLTDEEKALASAMAQEEIIARTPPCGAYNDSDRRRYP